MQYTAATENAAATAPPPPRRRQSTIDPTTAEALEKRLAHRPDKHELMDRNILKGASHNAHLPCIFMLICSYQTTKSLRRFKPPETSSRSPSSRYVSIFINIVIICSARYLQDKLDQALLQRPKKEELIAEGILSKLLYPCTAI